jgi:hypothetical protein
LSKPIGAYGILFLHAEYPSVSVSRKLLSKTPPKTSPHDQCELPHVQAANHAEALFTRTLTKFIFSEMANDAVHEFMIFFIFFQILRPVI